MLVPMAYGNGALRLRTGLPTSTRTAGVGTRAHTSTTETGARAETRTTITGARLHTTATDTGACDYTSRGRGLHNRRYGRSWGSLG
jgi:hypothetical protein